MIANSGPIFINKKGFKKIILDYYYPYNYSKEEVVASSLLLRILLKKTACYKTKESFINAQINHYVQKIKLQKSTMGNQTYYHIEIVIPNKNALNMADYSYEKTLAFINDSILNPCTINNQFLEEDVEEAKTKLKNYIAKNLSNINSYAAISCDKIIDQDNQFLESIYQHRDEINALDSQSLYTFFQKTIATKKPYLFVTGEIDSSLKKAVRKVFPNNLESILFKNNFIEPLNIKEKVCLFAEEKPYQQSVVKIAYKVKDYNKQDRVILYLLDFLLNSQSSNILMDTLRKKYNLVYTASCTSSLDYGIFLISALISKENKEKTIQAIKEMIENLKDESFVSKPLKNVITRKKIDLEWEKDSLFNLSNDFIISYFQYGFSLKEEYEILKQITAKDVVDFINRLVLDTIYYLEGTK